MFILWLHKDIVIENESKLNAEGVFGLLLLEINVFKFGYEY